LATLPTRHICNGISEIIKVAIACDGHLFMLIENDIQMLIRKKFQTATGDEAIARAISAMLSQLCQNWWERDLRRSVDFGHTFSPRLELASRGSLLHGESVAIDMAICCGISVQRRLLDNATASRIVAVMKSAGLPLFHKLCKMPILLTALEDSVRRRDGHQHIFLPTSIGSGIFAEDVRYQDIKAAIKLARNWHETGSAE
jgi:3-dehydroquinate synthase